VRVLLTITTNAIEAATESATGRVAASDLGYLLHKHPDRVQAFDLPVGTAHVFYPEVSENRCTAALLLEVDPIGLVRGKRFGGDAFALAQYVNDRPYAASSVLAFALGKVGGTALKGRCAARPDLEGVPLPLRIAVPAVPCSGGADLVRRLFTPLGWDVTARTLALDPQVPAWGDSRYVDLVLEGTMPLADALSHLYVLLPVLDGAKHYWVSTDEVDKLVRNSGAWLSSHPERDLVTRRYLRHQRSFVADATARLEALDDTASDASELDATASADGSEPEPPTTLVRLRAAAVLSALRDVGAHRVVDLGCGEGALLRELLADPTFTEVVGVDVAAGALERAGRRLALERMPDSMRGRLTLRQSSATYRDRAMEGYDAVVLMEVVEHLDLDRLPALERSVFGHARPASVAVTTPNAEYNVRYERLTAGTMRHPDHRFEWTRSEFAAWASGVAERYGYAVELRPVGEEDPLLGPPTQLGLFRRAAVSLSPADESPSVDGGAA
jgi:3' terminal RNA ribose 2'-O-methyltransferase Hen1